MTDLELKDNAAVAWIVDATRANSSDPAAPREVWADDAFGRRKLDAGSDIELRSLELTGTTLTWSQGGSERTAELY